MIPVLYISYDGVCEPLGQSQILPYLSGLAALGAAITLISFEKPADLSDHERMAVCRREIAARGIRWMPLRYHKRPTLLATSYDVAAGLCAALSIVLRDRVKIVHSRSYIPALMAWVLKRLLGVRFIFDMRAFWADERAESGLLAQGGRVYRVVKGLERRFLADADEVVTLTEAARSVINQQAGITVRRVSVVPTCVDLERFAPRAGAPRDVAAPVFVYAGSIASWYLPEEMLRLFARARARLPRARFLILTRQRRETEKELASWKFPEGAVTLLSVPHDQVPSRLAQAHAGLALYKPGQSRTGTCPTKIGEYLAMGLPVVVNHDVGDVEEIVGKNDVGVVIRAFTPEACDRAVQRLESLWADPTLSARCRRVAETYFSLQLGMDRYWSIYQRLA
ncbi:MAG: glycosyltransferase family 4 protein [Desulfomonile tiedjei]|nr:glycosyltransferase family 4 protein [Desulfomonile tiedjei]